MPVSHNLDIPKELGLRHRAAMGISQVSDAHAIIMSEETGAISVAYKGQFHLKLSAEELESLYCFLHLPFSHSVRSASCSGYVQWPVSR